MRVILLAALATNLALPARAGDRDFDHLVHQLEGQYGKRKLSIPFFGFANFVVRVARPAGARDLKVAIFEDIDGRRHPRVDELDAWTRTLAAGSWKPFVRVNERRSGERVQVYSRRRGTNDWELLVATLERSEAVLARVRVNPEELARWVNRPAQMARHGGSTD